MPSQEELDRLAQEAANAFANYYESGDDSISWQNYKEAKATYTNAVQQSQQEDQDDNANED